MFCVRGEYVLHLYGLAVTPGNNLISCNFGTKKKAKIWMTGKKIEEMLESKGSRTRTISGNSGKTGPEQRGLTVQAVGLFMRGRESRSRMDEGG
jgi:hypothetical protein